jgi:hypothetical protein
VIQWSCLYPTPPRQRTPAPPAVGAICELRAADAAERQRIEAGLLADLGRPATMTDRVAAANIAALQVKAERLEHQGRDAFELRKQIAQ